MWIGDMTCLYQIIWIQNIFLGLGIGLVLAEPFDYTDTCDLTENLCVKDGIQSLYKI